MNTGTTTRSDFNSERDILLLPVTLVVTPVADWLRVFDGLVRPGSPVPARLEVA